ncbi:hypothetical protein EVAR_53953_1 [Eumeta japonica]|uniref:Uncharacterized protein n=1 Tax=Eumeta variegata TaxID=151549 RepID=A0A4C1XY59_EUMVA|nr:hypothetical protein EVAR_53953_1 [Eumeta japonica]
MSTESFRRAIEHTPHVQTISSIYTYAGSSTVAFGHPIYAYIGARHLHRRDQNSNRVWGHARSKRNRDVDRNWISSENHQYDDGYASIARAAIVIRAAAPAGLRPCRIRHTSRPPSPSCPHYAGPPISVYHDSPEHSYFVASPLTNGHRRIE